MDFFTSKPVLNSDEIVKEGMLVKQSKYRKVWRERWSVLTLKNIYTFKSERVYSSPTETIDVTQIKTVKSDENPTSNIFHIYLDNSTFSFQAKSFEEKEAWIGAIETTTLKPISKHREEYTLTLRKDKLNDYIMNKRLGGGGGSPVEYDLGNYYIGIKSETAILNEEEMKFFESQVRLYIIKNDEVKLAKISAWLKLNDEHLEHSYKRFGIFKLRKLVESSMKIRRHQSLLEREELIGLLMNEVLNTKLLEFKQEICFIFAKLTYSLSKLPLLLNADFLQNLLNMSYSCPLQLTEQIIIVIGNLLVEDKKYVLTNTTFLKRLKEFVCLKDFFGFKFSICPKLDGVPKGQTIQKLNINIPVIVLWNLNLITVDCPKEELMIFFDWIPYLMDIVSRENIMKVRHDEKQEEVNQILTLLKRFSNISELAVEMLNYNLIEHLLYLIEYLNFKPNSTSNLYSKDDLFFLSSSNLSHVLVILNNIWALDNNYLSFMTGYSDKFVQIFENLLLRYKINHKDDMEVIISIVRSLTNVVTCDKQSVDKFLKSRIPFLLVTYFKKNEEILHQIIIFFSNSLESCSLVGLSYLMKTTFVDVLCDTIKSASKKDVLLICLKCFGFIFSFLYQLEKESKVQIGMENYNTQPFTKGVIEEFVKHSLITRLEMLSIHVENKISEQAFELIKHLDRFMYADFMVD